MAKLRHEVAQPEDQGIRLIALTRGMNAIVDLNDYESVAKVLWMASCFDGKWYAARSIRMGGKKITILLHRVILGLNPGDKTLVDHEDGDGLNCRRLNLRTGTPAQNSQNRRPWEHGASKFKGVRPHQHKAGMWLAEIKIQGKTVLLGVFSEEESAALAYDAAASEHYGEFAWLNFPSAPCDQHQQPRLAPPFAPSLP